MIPFHTDRTQTLRWLALAVLGLALGAQDPPGSRRQPPLPPPYPSEPTPEAGPPEPGPKPEAVAPEPAPDPAVPALAREQPATILQFDISKATLQAGEWIDFQWATWNADWVVLEPLGIRLAASGLLSHRPAASATYWLSATNRSGGQAWPVALVVLPFPGAANAPAAAAAPAGPAAPVPVPGPAAEAMVPPPPPPVQPGPGDANGVWGQPRPGENFWIQFAAVSTQAGAEVLARRLAGLLGARVGIERVCAAGGAGPCLFRVHTGPFPVRAVAQIQLRDARRRIPARLAKPIIVAGSPPLPAAPEGGGQAGPRRVRHRSRRP